SAECPCDRRPQGGRDSAADPGAGRGMGRVAKAELARNFMLTLYDYLDSGNGYKIRLLLAQLDRSYRRLDLDITKGQTLTPELLAKNPNGRIPTLELESGACLPESNAILWYLAHGSSFIPTEPLAQAQVLQWMFFEQYSHEPYVATPRFILKHLPADSPRR